MEVLLNVYDRINITEQWSQAVPPELYQKYRDFYDSLFSLAGTPRSLQHLCRCVIRSALGGRCASLVPTLPCPRPAPLPPAHLPGLPQLVTPPQHSLPR
eukprot:gi/632992028/ref/XP_007884891.1/ PREDICTED: ankyrin repeat and SOCS box protein 18-like [Callorhinchus milii]